MAIVYTQPNIWHLGSIVIPTLSAVLHSYYLSHGPVHSGEGPFSCSWCGICLPHSKYLSCYLLTHTGKLSYFSHGPTSRPISLGPQISGADLTQGCKFCPGSSPGGSRLPCEFPALPRALSGLCVIDTT